MTFLQSKVKRVVNSISSFIGGDTSLSQPLPEEDEEEIDFESEVTFPDALSEIENGIEGKQARRLSIFENQASPHSVWLLPQTNDPKKIAK